MNIAVASVLCFFVVMFSFQNCQKAPHPDEISNSSDNLSSQNVSKVDLQKEQLESVNFIVQDVKPFVRGGNTIDIKYNKSLKIDMDNGVIVESNDIDNTTAQFCLTDELKSELQTIIKSAQVCTLEGKKSGQACAQVIVPPYAQITTDKDQFDLGSASDSCGSNSQDLCGEYSDMLKAFLQNLKTKYQSMSCPQN